MNVKKILSGLVLGFCALCESIAQNKSVAGVVYDADTKESLPYTNIVVAGQSKGTVSNGEGQYVLDLEGIGLRDTILFSYMGYETLKMTLEKLQDLSTLYLRPAAINLSEVEVLSKKYTAYEIVALVEKNYKKNYFTPPYKQQLFVHKYEKVPFSKQNKLILKKSNFVGLDRRTFDELFKKIPSEFIEYRDAKLDWYQDGKSSLLVPIEGISLEEGSQQALMKEFENKLSVFFEDIEKTKGNKDIYYKFRTGILSHNMKQDEETEASWDAYKKDTSHYTIDTELIKDDLLTLFKDYSHLDGKNWEFISDRNKYEYDLKEMTILNGELVYEITFVPNRRGLFEGSMYVSTGSFAILELDFAFANGKQDEKFQLLGLGHSMNYKKGRVIFEKGKAGYFVKYIYAQEQQSVSVNRSFSLMKKQKRFFIDKELSEIKMEAHLFFDIESFWEVLVLDRGEIDSPQFQKVQQPATMKFRKEYAYSPEMWSNRTVLSPNTELKKYKRK